MIGFMAVEQGVEEAKLAVEHIKKSDFPFSPFPLSGLSCIDLYYKFGVFPGSSSLLAMARGQSSRVRMTVEACR